MDYDRMIFRVWLKKHGGGVIAVLPDAEANPGMVVCYEHVGQHGEGRWSVIVQRTRPATVEEREPLRAELESIGYKPLACKRFRRAPLAGR